MKMINLCQMWMNLNKKIKILSRVQVNIILIDGILIFKF